MQDDWWTSNEDSSMPVAMCRMASFTSRIGCTEPSARLPTAAVLSSMACMFNPLRCSEEKAISAWRMALAEAVSPSRDIRTSMSPRAVASWPRMARDDDATARTKEPSSSACVFSAEESFGQTHNSRTSLGRYFGAWTDSTALVCLPMAGCASEHTSSRGDVAQCPATTYG